LKIFREKKKGSIRALGGLEQEAGHADADCRGVQETDTAGTLLSNLSSFLAPLNYS